MVQAARSGKQNIAEASRASGTSAETEIKLTNVARASLEELRLDYEDYLRTRRLPIWEKDSREARFVRNVARNAKAGYGTLRAYAESRPAGIAANIALCLIHQANYLLDRQIRKLEEEFASKGGIRERMTRVRLQYRKRQQG